MDVAFTTDRVAFSAGSGDGTLAVMGRIRRYAERNEGYDMSLNASDAAAFVELLAMVADEHEGGLAEWAMQMLSDVAETLNVELI